jgi:hypoxanthine phosphoribosyltransferase
MKVIEISLKRLPMCVDELSRKVAEDGFRPDTVVFLERGARLLGLALGDRLGARALGIRAQRGGGRIKGMLSGLAGALPPVINNWLRAVEARLLWRKKPDVKARAVSEIPDSTLKGGKVLIVDDAVDSGSSILGAMDWCERSGVAREDMRVACITETTGISSHIVNYTLYREMCRFPWSSDSPELSRWKEAHVESGGSL